MDASETTVDRADPASEGHGSYPRSTLRVYDVLAYRINGPLIWRCPVSDLLELYNEHASGRHLDIGVGTGYLLDRCRFPVSHPAITLMDLNPNPLTFAARRLRRFEPQTHQANVLAPWGLPECSFDSVAMFNVLHCVPGRMSEKAVVFEHARAVLAPRGTLFGATVLNGGVEQTRLSRSTLKRLNQRGGFNNLDDHLDDLDSALARTFGFRDITVHGSVALFSARAEG